MKKERNTITIAVMLAGCMAMLAGILALASSGAGGNRFGYLLLLLCPAVHLILHRKMHRSGEHHESPPRILPDTDFKMLEDGK